MWKRLLVISLAIFLLAGFVLAAGCETEDGEEALPEKDKLVFGGVRSQTGPLAVFDETAFGPIYRMWADEVNARGGIYVEEYGKQLPVELLIYDDTSDMGTMNRLLEKLMVEDKVDFLLPPTSTAFLFAAAQLANDHGYLLLGAEGGATELEPIMAELPYFFSILNYCTHQVPALVDMLAENDIKTAYIIYIGDQHGIEYSDLAKPLLEEAGIEIIACKSIPPGIDDVSSMIAEAQAADVDAFLAFVYPDEGFLAVSTAMGMGFNPDVFLIGPGGNFQFFKDDVFGPATEGVMCWGAWNEKSSAGAAEFLEKFCASEHGGLGLVDWWGHLPYYASLEVLERAIEKAGTIDHSVLKDVIASEKFETCMGEIWFVNGGLPPECYAGQVGQWIEGKFEVIAPAHQATANPVIPKPPWPAPEEE